MTTARRLRGWLKAERREARAEGWSTGPLFTRALVHAVSSSNAVPGSELAVRSLARRAHCSFSTARRAWRFAHRAGLIYSVRRRWFTAKGEPRNSPSGVFPGRDIPKRLARYLTGVRDALTEERAKPSRSLSAEDRVARSLCRFRNWICLALGKTPGLLPGPAG